MAKLSRARSDIFPRSYDPFLFFSLSPGDPPLYLIRGSKDFLFYIIRIIEYILRNTTKKRLSVVWDDIHTGFDNFIDVSQLSFAIFQQRIFKLGFQGSRWRYRQRLARRHFRNMRVY